MADHNDPNAVNSIFSDVDVSAADVYDMFGYPSDATDEEKVVARADLRRRPGRPASSTPTCSTGCR